MMMGFVVCAKKQLKKRGSKTLLGLSRLFRRMDRQQDGQRDGRINRVELEKALLDFHIDIPQEVRVRLYWPKAKDYFTSGCDAVFISPQYKRTLMVYSHLWCVYHPPSSVFFVYNSVKSNIQWKITRNGYGANLCDSNSGPGNENIFTTHVVYYPLYMSLFTFSLLSIVQEGFSQKVE